MKFVYVDIICLLGVLNLKMQMTNVLKFNWAFIKRVLWKIISI